MNSSLSSSTRVTKFLVNQVYSKDSTDSIPMIVKEYKKIGEGAFGIVVQAKLRPYTPSDSINNNNNNNNDDITSISSNNLNNPNWYGPFAIKRVPAQTEYKSRELEILRTANHPNVIQLKFFFNYKAPQDNKIYQHLVMECLPESLQLEIHRYTSNRRYLPQSHLKIYSFQIARAMLYLHGLDICHRDIKPSNILVDPSTGILKICDFGSSKRLESDQPSVSYICSRFYRAPELIVGCQYYSTQIDIWGLGCVVGEMSLGRAVFQGQDRHSQLKEIAKVLGPPDRLFIFNSNPRYDGPLYSTPLFAGRVSTRFKTIFRNAPLELIDLLLNILRYHPNERFVPVQILAHKYFDELRGPDFQWKPRGSISPQYPPDLFNFSSFEKDLIGEQMRYVCPYNYH
ncbi:serine/threonine/tyrosine protein kinase MCK1 [Ascoidea rubescens DSM 1968]|uniref:Pkinase-domain-containing protein n=1 Tax=Ascoidea rubescens DSM 1968 TaxID=1344418 RepID=A0A1D2VI10_9ASCO|nr:Pkinase-domain-containing protein [Ascoidea rubescens DSM 1968]ODV61117.1 Pkinase-domain-containing protein [Ascoidea rubescens DSM 1968]